MKWLEQINIRSRYGAAKVIKTVASIGGATILTLYKGPPLLHQQHQNNVFLVASSNTILSWTLGCVYILGNCIAMGLVALVISFSLQKWCIDKGGPLFAVVFYQVQTLVVDIMAAVIVL
ncbi:hypothetical protein Cni_G10285 [Canna indica]|uniref:WAT1-related protein n=1 Tax=Canna indica TaxID=4628 RepID=A0AAQ3K692_9LILI|nr:hypothetical protein Cni_G10285 [Canna indica]